MIKILGLYPMNGNGGIASWTKKYLSTFPDEEYVIVPVNIAPDKDFTKYSGLDRIWYGTKAILRIFLDVKRTLKANPDISIMHITTSGGFGALRDHLVMRLCHKHHVKTIMHCRFGTIKEFYEGSGLCSRYFRKNVYQYDQTWVLDRRSTTFLKSIEEIKEKIYLTPNSIEVPDDIEIRPKEYKKIGFIGNIVPTKGIFELVQAVVSLENSISLYIAGPGSDEDIKRLKLMAGDKMDKTIFLLGKLPNSEAVKMMESMDILCLPTYYPGEAFPISILEAMSRGKLVISCPRAAIPDMLTSLDGSRCGVLVPEKDSQAIEKAVEWCQEHIEEADDMCKKAYDKVRTCYRKEIVYDIYRNNYLKLLKRDY